MNDDKRLLKDQSWAHRHPRVFSITGSIFFTLIIFSYPLYKFYETISFSNPPIEKNEK